MTEMDQVRAFRADDAPALRALISARLGSSLYEARAREILDAALAAGGSDHDVNAHGDDEHLGFLIPIARQAMAGAVIGVVAGAVGAWRVHWALGENRETLTALLHHAVAVARARGARLIVCELPDDKPFVLTRQALAHAGFTIEGAVPDFVRAGIALQLWVARR